MGGQHPTPLPGTAPRGRTETQERDQGPAETVPELRAGSAETRPLQPPQARPRGRFTQTEPREGPSPFPLRPCTAEGCSLLPFPFLPASLQRAGAGSEGGTAPTASPSASARAEASGGLPAPGVPCPLPGGPGSGSPRTRSSPGPGVQSWGRAGQKGTCPSPEPREQVPEEGRCRSGWHRTGK